MASQPPAPPTSIVVTDTDGVRNTISAERLGPRDLEAAINVDIDDTGQMRRRRGFAKRATGNFHSAFEADGVLYVVKNGVLGMVSLNDFGFTALDTVGDRRVSYTTVNKTVYYSSEAASGKIVDGVRHDWGVHGGDGIWDSPVVNPTATLGAIRGRLLGPPPMASEIESYKGRIYMAAGNVVWATELWRYDYVDRTRNYLQFEGDVTLLAGMDSGMYVGTEQGLIYLSGVLSTGFTVENVYNVPVLRGSAQRAPSERIERIGRQGPLRKSIALLLMAQDGVYGCFDGGEVYNLTRDRMVFPNGADVAVLYREDRGSTNYIAAINSAGTPAANARIGDHVSAELVRAADRLGG